MLFQIFIAAKFDVILKIFFVKINKSRLEQHFEAMSLIGKIGETGTCRPAHSSLEKEAFQLASSWMQEAGMTTRIDHFGNLYFNLTKKLFEEIGKGRSFAIPVRSQTTINKFHERFVDVEVGNEVAFWGQNDYLVISMNREGGGDRAGTFNRLMNLDLGDSLTISFHGDANR